MAHSGFLLYLEFLRKSASFTIYLVKSPRFTIYLAKNRRLSIYKIFRIKLKRKSLQKSSSKNMKKVRRIADKYYFFGLYGIHVKKNAVWFSSAKIYFLAVIESAIALVSYFNFDNLDSNCKNTGSASRL